MPRTIVHLVRHGEVHNPGKVLYGRLPGYRLSDLGQQMAERVADHFAAGPTSADVAVLVASPLQRAQETAAPLAGALGLDVRTDERVIEAGNDFEGLTVGSGEGAWWRWQVASRLWNPWRPSWGEPFAAQAARMFAAIAAARSQAEGHEAVIVSHQSPIWIARRALERKPLAHDPRRRECSLASVTSLTFSGGTLVALDYSEPAADLLPGASAVPGA